MSFAETVFLFLLALIIFGPKKLPEIARQVGKYLNEFKRASNEFKSQIEQEISQLERQQTPKILEPSQPVAGSWSRSEPVPPLETGEVKADSAATLAAPAEPAPPDPAAQPPATEAVAADPVTSTSQESHA